MAKFESTIHRSREIIYHYFFLQISVVAMTTRKQIEGVTKDVIRKPALFKLYDYTMTGYNRMENRLDGLLKSYLLVDTLK